MPDLKQALRDFITTANSGKYTTEEELMSKFPELQGYDIQVLRDFITTANSGKYTDEETLFSKFPEFKFDQQQPVQQPLVPMSPLKKKEASTSPSESGVLERYGFNAKRALGQEEQKPIMTQPLPERLQPAQKKDSKTWERETALPEVITGYTKPAEEVSLLRPKEKPAEEPLGLIGRYVPERDEKKTPKFIEETLSALTPDKFNLTGTEPSKKALEYYLKDMGFKIEDSDKSSSYAGKYVNVISPSGEKHLFYLGNEIIRKETFGYAGLPSEDDIEQLKDFVRASAFSDSSIAKKEYLYEKENKKFKTKESIDNEVKDISAQEQKFQDDYKSMLALQKDIEDIEKDLKRWEDFGEQNTPKYIQTKAYLNDKIKEYNDYIGTLKNKEATLSTQAQQLEKSMGKYFEFQSTQGSFEGTLYRSIAESSANIFSNYLRAATSRTFDALPMSALMDEDLYKEERLRKLKEKGYEDGTAPQSAIEEVDAEIRDRFKKAAITGKIGEEKLQNVLTVQGVRESLKDFVTSVPVMGTSEYKERREKEGGFVERGVIGLAGSLPAMVGNRYLRLANMFMMTTDAVMQEMDNDPSFANVSENEKELIAAPIGVIGAALEEIGLRNLIKGTSITSSIVKSVLGRVPSNATASTIRKATFDAVKEMGLRGTVALAGATLAEAETGAAQQISEYAVKDIYNAMKGEKRFDNPAFLSGQYFYDIYDAARTEAVGGFVMGVPYSAAAAFKKDGFRGLDDETFKIFEQLAKDNDSKKFFVTDLKNKINRGEITPQQGKQILDAYNEASGMIGVVPDEITDTESRKIAMDLLSERKKLETKKQGKDDALAKPIQDKINKINEQLSKLTEDAIQKQAAGEVSLQPETGAGQEVEVGGPEAKPKITPEESKRKEDLVAALEATDKDVIAIGDELLDRKEAQAELDAITQKEQAAVIEQGGMEQAEGLGTQLEMVAKEEQIPTEVTPATEKKPLNFAVSGVSQGYNVWQSGQKVEAIENKDPRELLRNSETTEITPEGSKTKIIGRIAEVREGGKVAYYAIAQDAKFDEDQEFTRLKDFVGRSGPIAVMLSFNESDNVSIDDVRAALVEKLTNVVDKSVDKMTFKTSKPTDLGAFEFAITPKAVEVAPTEVAPTETRTAEQEADLLEELLTGKKKEPVSVEPMAIEPVVEEEAKVEIPKAEDVAETDIEIKDTQTTPEEVQQQIETFDEEALPEEEKPKPGTVAELSIEDINADPERFQYKEVTDKEAGVTEQFKGKMPFRKELAGVISVWVDPADGKTYVINGHHRLEFAKRSGEKTMNVIYIDAKDASEARLKGAMQNIAEGMGTDMDAAKVFRETGMTVEQVQQSGINVKGAKAMNGLSLASLSDNLFNLVTQGKLSQTVGIIIGSTIKSKDVQEQFYNVIKGKNLNNGTIKVMAEDIQAAPTENVEQMDLFGVSSTEQAAYQQRASFIAGIRSIVSKAKNILGKAAKSASFLEEYGNEIDVATTETGSRESAMALAVFDRLRNTSSEIRELIDKGVERIKNGENKNKVLNETAKQIIEATPRILEGVTGQPVAGRGEVKEPSTKGKQGATGKKLADAVRKNLKIKGPDGLQSNILGIPIAIWNAGVETVAKSIEVGMAVNDAIKRGINYIKEKHGKKINEVSVERKILIGLYSGAIQTAREAGITEEGLKTYLTRKGVTEEQIETLLKYKKRGDKKPISKEKITGKPKPKMVTVTVNDMTELKKRIKIEAKAAKEGKKQVRDAVKEIVRLFNKSKVITALTRADLKKIINLMDKVYDDVSLQKAVGEMFDIILKSNPDLIEVSKTKLAEEFKKKVNAGIRQGKKDLNTKRKELTAAIKEMVKKGKITVRQAAVLINKVNAVNLDNPVMVERLLDYAEKVFNNAEFVEKMSRARKLLKTAKENVRTKIGVSEGLTTLMNKLFNINPNIIPDDVLESYLELVETMGKRQAVLTLKEAAELTKDVEKVLDSIDNELSVLDELIDIFDNYDDKVLDDNGKIDYAATIDKMLEAGVITASDAKLYKKYKDKVLPKEAREKKSEEQLAEEKKDLIEAVAQTQVNENKLEMREERDAARKLFDAMTPENLAKLTNAELKNLLKVLDNINNGFMPHYAVLMTQKLNAASRSATLDKAITNAGKLPITKLLANIKSLFPGAKSANMIMVINSPKYAIDQIFGYFKSTPIYDSVFKPIVQAFASYKTDARKVKEKLDNAFNKVARSYMNNPAKIKMSQFKMMTYALQLEYNSNKDKGEGFYSAAEYINETIKHARGDQSTMSKKDVEFLDKILKVYGTRDADGNIDIDIDKLYNSFNNAEKQAIKAIQEVNLSIRDKAMFTAAVVRGDKMKPIDNYIHHNVLPTGVTDTDLRSVTQDMNARMMPSTRAKVLKERTKGAKPLNFNIFNATQKAANEVLMDFHLTEAVRTSRMVLNNTRKELQERGNEKQLNAFNAVAQSFETTLDNTLTNTFNDSSFVDSVVSLVTKQAYRTLLAGASRWTAELLSNLSYVSIVNPIAYKNGITKYRKFVMSEKGPAILRNIGSAVQDRIYESSVLSGRMIDGSIMDEAIGLNGTTSNYMVVNAMQTIYNNTLKKGQNFVAATADALISTPDKMALRPFWFGVFAQNFKKETGQDVDYEKLAANDEAYLSKFKNAINKSKDVADSQAMLAGGTKNPFAARQKSMSVKGASALAQMYQSFNNFLNSFIINEYIAARTGVYAMMGNGRLNRRQGAAILAGVTTRTTLYTLLVKELGRGLAWLLLGDDDEEDEEKSIIEKAGQAFAGSMTSLILGRDFGNMTRSMINYGVEKVNENYVQDMMDGKYTKEDVIAYNSLIPSSLNGRPQFSDLMINMTGPAQPILRSLKNLYENSFAAEAKGKDTIKKRENYWKYTLPLEAAGHLGFVPLYKDVRTITNKALQGEVNAIKEAKEEEKASKAEAYGGYETLKEFEEKDPIKYDEYSAPGGKLYQYREGERKEKEEKNKDQPFRGLSEKKFKELYPEEWRKNYGPGTNYYKSQRTPEMLQKKAQEKRDEAKRERERKMKEAIRKREENIRKALSK